MKTHLQYLLMAGLLALSVQTMKGQSPSVYIDYNQTGLVPGNNIQVPVVIDGTAIGTWQLVLSYDSAVLSYQSMSSSLPPEGSGIFAFTSDFDPSGGTTARPLIRMAYACGVAQSPGYSYSSSTPVITLTFTYKGGTTPIEFVNISTLSTQTANYCTYIKQYTSPPLQTMVLPGPFTSGSASGGPPENNALENILIQTGSTECYDATNLITTAGNGTYFTVQSGGQVTLIAGNTIRLLSGTTVSSGGNLHGYITTTGDYCGALLNPLVAALPGDQNPFGIKDESKEAGFIVFPNPTAADVTVKINHTVMEDPAWISVYTMQGKTVLSRQIDGDRFTFSLSGMPDGVYLVCIQRGVERKVMRVLLEAGL